MRMCCLVLKPGVADLSTNDLIGWNHRNLGRFIGMNYKMLSYRRETALQGALQFSPKAEDWNWETIFY